LESSRPAFWRGPPLAAHLVDPVRVVSLLFMIFAVMIAPVFISDPQQIHGAG